MKKLFVILLTFFSLSAFSQTELDGTWNTGQDNSIVAISEVDGELVGKIKSSDNQEVEIGTVILKDLEKKGLLFSHFN